MRSRVLLLCVPVILTAFAGCSDHITIVQPRDTGLAEVEIEPDAAEFTITIPTGGTAAQPLPGPFVIRGTNIEYNEGIGALLVDLTVTNASRETYPLPVRLEFVLLLPDGVTILNPSNDEHGVGARIDFHFVNRDLSWSPGETSIPRSVQFGVEPGVSVGFGARILVGPETDLGTISGVAWHDVNEDGLRDPGELGIPGREIVVTWTDSLVDCVPPTLDCPRIKSTITGEDGSFAFHELAARYYTVFVIRDRCSHHTTPIELQVILVDENGQVSDFTDADFGILPIRDC